MTRDRSTSPSSNNDQQRQPSSPSDSSSAIRRHDSNNIGGHVAEAGDHSSNGDCRGGGDMDPVQDVVLKRIGSWGPWQRRVFYLLAFRGLLSAWQVFSPNFTAPDQDHWCARPAGDPRYANWTTLQWKEFAIPPRQRLHNDVDYSTDNGTRKTLYSQCEMYDVQSGEPNKDVRIPCTSWEYDHTVFPNTLTSDWDLVCNRKALRRAMGSVYMAGYLAGVFVYGIASDKFGRRPATLVSCAFFAVFAIAEGVVTNVYVFMVARFLAATGMAGSAAVAFVLLMEMIGGSYRSTVGIGIHTVFCFGSLTLPMIAYFIRPWRQLQLAISFPALLYIFYYCLLPESPRWLLTQGETERAEDLMEKAEILNGRRTKGDDKNLDRQRSITELKTAHAVLEKEKEIARSDGKKANFLDLFRTPNLRKRTVNIYYNWFVNAFVYYGLSLNVGDLGGDVYLNAIIGGAMECVSQIFCALAILYWGRRWPLCLSLVIGGLACSLTVVIPAGNYYLNWPVVLLASIGKLGITSSFGIIYIVSAEIFPTVIRNTGVGSSSTVARVGSIIAPFVPMLDDHVSGGLRISMILFGGNAILAGLLTLLLPETNKKKLPDTIEEGEKFE